jgi:hypothetical protein
MTSMKGEIAKDGGGGGACDDLYGLKGCGKSKIQTPNKKKRLLKLKRKEGRGTKWRHGKGKPWQESDFAREFCMNSIIEF